MQQGFLKTWLFGLLLGWGLAPAAAHEFWVAPQDYTPVPGARIVTALKVGQMMKGTDYPYLSNRFQSFTITTRRGTRNAKGIEGDSPALNFVADEPGLHIIAFYATPHRLAFDTFGEFVEYLDYEGLGEIAQTHLMRGLPETGIIETYIRCAKSLVQVGPITELDRDRPTGLPFELVAEVNPYAGGLEALPVTLTWQGKPVAGRQIAVFRESGEVTRSLVTTNADGQALISLASGGEFLLNAVNIEPADDGEVAWKSHWATLTFALPRRE